MQLISCSCLAFVLSLLTAHAQVLVSDFNLARIVRFDADGSGSSVLVASGVGGLDLPHRTRIGADGLLYVASAGTDQVLRFNATSSISRHALADGAALDPFATGAPLNGPNFVTVLTPIPEPSAVAFIAAAFAFSAAVVTRRFTLSKKDRGLR